MIPNAADFILSDELLQTVDSNQFKESLGLKDKFVITYVGAHGVANHLIQVLECAKEVTDLPIVFQLIGTGMQKEELVRKKEEWGLRNVFFRDPVPKAEVFKYILASDMGASILKKAETFKTIYSNKTFDYMACKKPVLLLIDGVSRELIEKADCGVYVEPEDINDFVTKIRHLFNEGTDLSSKGENGYHYAKKHFDRTVLAEKYLKIIQSLSKK